MLFVLFFYVMFHDYPHDYTLLWGWRKTKGIPFISNCTPWSTNIAMCRFLTLAKISCDYDTSRLMTIVWLFDVEMLDLTPLNSELICMATLCIGMLTLPPHSLGKLIIGFLIQVCAIFIAIIIISFNENFQSTDCSDDIQSYAYTTFWG